MHNLRNAFDEAVVNMSLSTSQFYNDYVFYMHLIAQCKVVFTETLPAAAAGVSFNNNHYVLYINPSEKLGVSKDGTIVNGFCEQMPLEHRIGILKHEMSHIMLGHLIRVEDMDHKGYNYASDCALNQDIKKEHLPDWVIMPHNLPAKVPVSDIKLRQSAEYYYDLLDFGQIEKGEGYGKDGQPCLDDHGVWKEISGDPELQKELTKNMVEKAGNETVKGRGSLPQNYSQVLENLTINREVKWEKVLRGIVGNKRVGSKKTLLRKNRRLPKANYLKGTTKERRFELGIISDISGSVSDKALYSLWGSIVQICKTFSADVKLVQVDTKPMPPVTLKPSTTKIERKACGGTYLSPAIGMFKEHGIRVNALVVTTDGELCQSDIVPFQDLKIPVIWLIEPTGTVMEGMDSGRMRAIKLKNFIDSNE